MKFFLTTVAFSLLLAIAVAGCGGSGDSTGGSSASTGSTESGSSKESTAPQESGDSTKSAPVTDKKPPKVTVPKGVSPDKFSFEDIEEGTGPIAKRGDEVTIEYVGANYKSGKEFGSSWESGPYTFTLGSRAVIKGGEQGIEGMKAGGRREMVIPSNLAYGAKGHPPAIPPNETLVFVVDLLAIK